MNEPAAPAKDAAAAAVAAGPAKKSSGMMGTLAAGVVLVGLGVGLGIYVAGLFTTIKTEGAAVHAVEEHKAAHTGIEHLSEISMPDLMANIRNQAGRRYIKVSSSFWLNHEDATKVGLAGEGGGHGGGGGGGGGGNNVKRILQMALEEHLRSYDIDELTGPNISLQLKKGFKDRIEKSLHELYPAFKDDHEFVHRVVLTNLLVQ
jgi:flagellar basal body-associated protein FliL